MRFPSALEVELVPSDGGDAPLAGVLVALDIRADSTYYFGTVLGLTDAYGRVRMTREELERDFADNRRLFPMDYRVPLADCAPEIGIKIQGGRAFREARAAAEANAVMPAEVREWWRRARNDSLESSRIDVDVREFPLNFIRVVLPIVVARASRPPA